MHMSFRQTVILTTAIIGLGSFAAVAASPTDTAPVRPTAAADSAKAKAAPDAERTMVATIERRIADLHTKLQITRTQEIQWAQFSQVMRENARVARIRHSSSAYRHCRPCQRWTT